PTNKQCPLQNTEIKTSCTVSFCPTITFPISELPGQTSNYDFSLQYGAVFSNIINSIAIEGSCYIPTFINVTSSTELVGGSKQITFTTNIPFPFQVQLSGNRLYPEFAFFFPIEVTASGTTITVTGIPLGPWAYHLQSNFTISNEFY
uniref:hypothetical protein n=1 Tax=Flavobacterium sp. TaxID=239 RepID=UPI00286A5655